MQTQMLESQSLLSYLSVIVVVALALSISGVILILNKLLGQRPKEVTEVKGDIYECGVPFEGDGHQQFSVRYYLIGIIFLIFDVEVVLMIPWALVYKKFLSQGPLIILEMIVFILILLVGYLYLRKRKALDWD